MQAARTGTETDVSLPERGCFLQVGYSTVESSGLPIPERTTSDHLSVHVASPLLRSPSTSMCTSLVVRAPSSQSLSSCGTVHSHN